MALVAGALLAPAAAAQHILSTFHGTTVGTQRLTLAAGSQFAGYDYWIYGSVTGTIPGIHLMGHFLPLNPDIYTGFTMTQASTSILARFRGTLDPSGNAAAAFQLPFGLTSLIGITLYHAGVVFDPQGVWRMTSNAVPLRLHN